MNGSESKTADIGLEQRAPMCSVIQQVFEHHRLRIIRALKFRLGSWEDAQDAVHDAFLRILLRQDHMHDTNLPALIFVTAHNAACDNLRRRRRENAWVGEQSIVSADHVGASPEYVVTATEQLQRVDAVLKTLSVKNQKAFRSYVIDGLTFPEIACQLGVSESMARKYIRRASAECRQRIA